MTISAYAAGQDTDSAGRKWDFNANALFYLVPDDFFVLPIVQADKGRLHLESRYNYEDRNTFSLFGGYHFSGGNKLSYTITPMLGAVMGQSDGIAPGLEADLSYGKFGFYSEMEYLFEFNDKSNNYYYNWSELTYAPLDWLWFGISGQRTRVYNTELGVERGFTLGAAWKSWELSGYLFNPFTDYSFGIVSLAVSF